MSLVHYRVRSFSVQTQQLKQVFREVFLPKKEKKKEKKRSKQTNKPKTTTTTEKQKQK